MKRLVEASGGDGTDEEGLDVPAIRGDDEPLFDDAVPLEPIPDDDEGCSCCHGGMISFV